LLSICPQTFLIFDILSSLRRDALLIKKKRAISATFNDAKTEIVALYVNRNALEKGINRNIIVQISEPNADKTISAVWDGNNIMLTTQSNQTIIKNSLEWGQ
jgi:hypothetical protein